MRRAAKRDLAEPAIVEALRDAGYWVWCISSPGFPDLCVGRQGVNRIVLLEVKDGSGELTDAQLKFWQISAGATRFVVRSAEAAVRVADTWIGRANGSSGGNDA